MDTDAGAARLSFGRERRLTRSAEFARVRVEGKAQRGSLMILGVLDAKDSGFRAGFVTSKRVGGAVERNRVRRRLREVVRRHQAEIRAGIWLVVIARPPAARATYAALKDEWLRLAKRAFILAP
ncbi:MAG: ribonuclease P protein component [Chthoniobacterales bacterium]